MARELSGRIVVSGTLITVDPLHVGSGEGDHTTDMAVSCDGQGRLNAVGTGIAGALRAWCDRRYGESLVNRFWGFQKGEDGHASHLLTADAVIRSPLDRILTIDDIVEVRDHVGIDRQFGTAAHHIKFDRAVLPPGCLLDLELALDLPRSPNDVTFFRSMLAHLLEALKTQSIRFGAAKTRGLGRVRLLDDDIHPLRITEQNWSLSAICQQLRHTTPQIELTDRGQAVASLLPRQIPRLTIQIDWTPLQPTMVKAGVTGLLVDTVPLIGSTGGSMAPVIPGSSLKGILRSRAEMILRTILKRDPDWRRDGTSTTRFLNQLDEELPLISQLFGVRGTRKGLDPNQDAVGQGALSVADCFSSHVNSADAWAALTYASAAANAADSARYAAVQTGKEAVGRESWHVASHNAIDRWKGGVADTALYQVLEPHGEDQWRPFELELDLDRVAQTSQASSDRLTSELPADSLVANQRDAAWMLLLLTLRDLARNRITVGFGGNRGLGEVCVKGMTISPAEGSPCGLTGAACMSAWDIEVFPTPLRTNWNNAWKSIIDVEIALVRSRETASV